MDIHTGIAVAQASSAVTGLNSSVWMAIFLAMILFFIVYSAVLIYHWFTFSMNKRTTIMATLAYIVISAVFIFSMLVSVVTLSTL
ncbi:MAG: hypothetical protein JKX80_02530 [Candidatus Pacebacteria bacterium]|nr:hypothetical protein [Candidatus Paceibacterota bacterium]